MDERLKVRKTWKTFAGSIMSSRAEQVIYMSDIESKASGTFDLATGAVASGNLDMDPDDVLFMAWRQKQSPSLSDKVLRQRWEERRP